LSENKGLRIFAFVLMPGHIHLIVKCSKGFQLEDTIRDLKKHTSKEIIKNTKEYPERPREWLLNKFSYAADRTKRGVNYKVWKDGL
jgi:REP element-mobilizing transposase RayT